MPGNGLAAIAVTPEVLVAQKDGAIRLDSKGPVFNTQTRVGKAGRLFKVVKFRTMRQDAEADGGGPGGRPRRGYIQPLRRNQR